MAGERHVRNTRVWPEAPERRGTQTTQKRIWATREDRCHPPAPDRQVSMADGVDAAMQPVETTKTQAVIDRARPKAEALELAARYDPVLPSCEGGDPPLNLART